MCVLLILTGARESVCLSVCVFDALPSLTVPLSSLPSSGHLRHPFRSAQNPAEETQYRKRLTAYPVRCFHPCPGLCSAAHRLSRAQLYPSSRSARVWFCFSFFLLFSLGGVSSLFVCALCLRHSFFWPHTAFVCFLTYFCCRHFLCKQFFSF